MERMKEKRRRSYEEEFISFVCSLDNEDDKEVIHFSLLVPETLSNFLSLVNKFSQ